MPCQLEASTAPSPGPSDPVQRKPDPAVPSAGLDTETRRSIGSCLASFLLHGLILLILALVGIGSNLNSKNRTDVVLSWDADTGAALDTATGDLDIPKIELPADAPALDHLPLTLPSSLPSPLPQTPQPVVDRGILDPGLRSKLNEEFVRPDGGGWEGRSEAARATLLAKGGGSGITEGAVVAGLEWLQRHQHDDGSWTFGFDQKPCEGQCRNSSDLSNTTGATGLALLCFLGRNHTHMNESPYRATVEKGIYYLLRRIKPTKHGGDLQEGTMYAQGIATLALCEAYGLTRDETLRDYAQSCVDFICYAQHQGGGWRYAPKQQGDTTVFGWQLMALKSAKLAGLRVPSLVTIQARGFLDSVAADEGAFYGYLAPGKEPTPTAVGLLCRMYTGWPRNHDPLRRGVDFLAARGPSKTDMYFNYYATQVMFHYRVGGWTGWNSRLSKYLIRTQAKTGHETGSWYFDDPYAEEAGRHYVTCLAIMILEVYYRHMPLYRDGILEKRF